MGLGFFTAAHGQVTVEYRLNPELLGMLFNRDTDTVPHGFCTTVSRLYDLARKRGVQTVVDLLDADSVGWTRRGRDPDDFGYAQVCVSIHDEFLRRDRYLDVRNHEHFHAQVGTYRQKVIGRAATQSEEERFRENETVVEYLTELFKDAGVPDALDVVVSMHSYSLDLKWSYTGRYMEEVLARVVGYDALVTDLRRKGDSDAEIEQRTGIPRSQYGGKVFVAFRKALGRTGKSPFVIMQEAIRHANRS